MHILIMLFFLSILILVHELGHFGVARMLGIKVEKFGFGLPFGPTLYETKWKDVKICVHAFLLGGYVSFPDDDPDSDVPNDDPGRISNRTVWERTLVVSAGVVANAIMAVLIVLFVATFSGGIPSGKYDVLTLGLQKENTVEKSGVIIKSDDKIISANGLAIDSPTKFIELAQRSKKFDGYVDSKKIDKQIEQIKALNPSLSKLEKSVSIEKGLKINLPVFFPEEALKIEDADFAGVTNYTPDGIPLSSTEEALRNKLDNKNVWIADGKTSISALAAATSDTVHPINIVVERKGEKLSLGSVYPNKEGRIGIKLKTKEIIVPTKTLPSIISASWNYIYKNTYFMVYGLVKLVTNQIPINDMHGIVAITKVGGDIIQQKGIWDGLLLMALISIDLAIVNLLPIPALDGGHLMFLLIEKIMGRPVQEETRETFAKYGFIFLIGLMCFIIFNDIVALVTDKL